MKKMITLAMTFCSLSSTFANDFTAEQSALPLIVTSGVAYSALPLPYMIILDALSESGILTLGLGVTSYYISREDQKRVAEIILGAKDDATYFIATDGVQSGASLTAALDFIREISPQSEKSDYEIALVIAGLEVANINDSN